VAGCCGHGNEYLGFIKCDELLAYPNNCWLFKKDFAAWN